MKKTESKKILKECVELSIQAGQKLLRFQKKIGNLKVSHKQAQGVASNADIEAEKFIIKRLKKIFPEASVLAEEDAYAKFKDDKNKYKEFKKIEYAWVVDPLDGTNNFLNGLDYYGVCISLVHYGQPILGVIHRPRTDETFFALKGEGCKKIENGKKAKNLFFKSNSKRVSDSLFVTGFVSEKGEQFDIEFDHFKKMMKEGRGIRRMGSAALDLCYVAEGIFDCFWERGLAPWDVSAAGIICQEAGVKVTTYSGENFHPFQETILAARNPLYKNIKKLF